MKTIHTLPGRLRLELFQLYRNENLAALMQEQLALNEGMVKIRANHHSGRILVEYSPNRWTDDLIMGEINRILPVLQDKPGEVSILKANRAGKRDLRAFELESLPIVSQAVLTAFSGAMLVYTSFQERTRQFNGERKPKGVFNIDSAVTILTSYPILRTAFEHLLKKGRLSSELIAGAATLASLVKEENRLSLLVIWLVYLSTLVRTMAVEGARDRIRVMLHGKKPVARIKTPLGLVIAPGYRVAPGAVIVARTGDRLPVDGRVVSGNGVLDMCPVIENGGPALITGGDAVFAGSKLVQGNLEIKVERVGKDTYINRMIREFEKGHGRATSNAHMVSLINKVSLFSLAAAGGVYALTGDARRAVNMLIVGAPGAAGMASSLPLGFAVGATARRGILVKDISYIDLMGRAGSVIFDHDALNMGNGHFDARTLELLREAGVHIAGVFNEHGKLDTSPPGQVSPEINQAKCDYHQKIGSIRKLQEKYIVAAVGDGTGEAQVLSAADVGISLSQGSDLDLQTADIVIIGRNLRQVAWLKRRSTRSLEVAKQNIQLSIGTNIFGLTMSALRLLSPAAMGLLLNASTLSILFNSARLFLPADKVAGHQLRTPAKAAANADSAFPAGLEIDKSGPA
ncbi:MAG: P-type ATPase [Bacillota bacterium]